MMKHILPLFLFSVSILAQAGSNAQCQSDCTAYLQNLEQEAGLNSNVQTYKGPVTASQVQQVCVIAPPKSCWDCGCGGLDSDTTAVTILAIWTVVCNTLSSAGVNQAVTCWTSQLKSGCVDYDGILGGGQCPGSSRGGSGGGSGGGGSQSSISTPGGTKSTASASAATISSPGATASSTKSSNSITFSVSTVAGLCVLFSFLAFL